MPSPVTIERAHDGPGKVVTFVKINKQGEVTAGVRIGDDILSAQQAAKLANAILAAVASLDKVSACASAMYQERE